MDLYQESDWKTEKHVPVIDILDKPKKGEDFKIQVQVGKEISHPNKTEHHIRWISLLFTPDGEKFPYQIGKIDFTAHGESVEGPDTSTVYSEPKATFTMKTEKKGKLIATSYCNIHGLWKNEQEISI